MSLEIIKGDISLVQIVTVLLTVNGNGQRNDTDVKLFRNSGGQVAGRVGNDGEIFSHSSFSPLYIRICSVI